MSENEQPVSPGPAQEPDAAVPAPAPDDNGNAAAAVRRGGLIVGLVIVTSLVLYLLGDRFTPYTSQARIQGYVIGVAPEVGGVVGRVWVENNAAVEAGQPLFEIEPSQYQLALDRARSDLEAVRRRVGAGGAAVEAARARLRAAEASALKARQDAERSERLRAEDPGTISLRRLEIAQASLEQANSQVVAAQADIRRAIEEMGGEDSEDNTLLNQAMTAVEKAELDLGNTVVRASSRGIITDLRADVGQYAGTGSPVMTLIAIHDVWISAEFTENNLGHLRIGTPVGILFDALPGRVFQGSVRSIGLGISAGQQQPAGSLPSIQNDRDWLRQSQRFPVVVGFDPDQDPELLEHLRIGGQASVMAYTEGHGVLAFLGRLYLRLLSWLSYAY